MLRLFSRPHKQPAQPPGTIVYTGDATKDRVRISATEYGPDFYEEDLDTTLEKAAARRGRGHVTWIDLDDLHDTELLQGIGERFGLHPLVLEDIVSTSQRPKAEEFEDYVYMVVKVIRVDPADGLVHSEQLSIVLGTDFIISFREENGHIFEPVRERIRGGKGRIRSLGAGYLAYALLDAVVDNYLEVLEKFNSRIEAMDEALTIHPRPEILQEIHQLKRGMIYMRKYSHPVRDLASHLRHGAFELMREETIPFLGDLHDHAIQVTDAVETFRDMLSSLQDLYLSSVSNRMNEVMKVLTIVATIFVPLTFLAGVYGMNFDFMPELHWKWSYPIFWVAILAAGAGMLAFFHRRGWL